MGGAVPVAGRRRAAGTDAAMSSLSPAKMTAGWTMDVGGSEREESSSSADGGGSHSGGVPNPEQLMQRRRQQEQRQQQVGGQARDDPERQRQQQREQQAAIVRSWGRSKEGEAARQKIKDAAHDHRIGWLKSGQVMQKVRKRLLGAICLLKIIFCQDRLGTNMGKAEKKEAFSYSSPGAVRKCSLGS